MSRLAIPTETPLLAKRVVIDASVAVKWFLPEEYADKALEVLQPGYMLLAPDLLYPEVGNVFWKRVHANSLTAEEANLLLETLGKVPFQIHPSKPLALPALEIACAMGRTVCDSLYIALAVREKAILLTADKRLFNALKDGPLAAHIRWLGTFFASAD